MAIKRQTKGGKIAEEVELAAYMIDNEADNLSDDVPASDLAHISLQFDAGSLPLNVFLHAMAAKIRDFAETIRNMK